MSNPTSFRLSDETTRQLAALAPLYNGNVTTVVTVAIDRLHSDKCTKKEEEGIVFARKFAGYDGSITGGPATEEEIAAARAVGYVNAYQESTYDVVAERQAKAPNGWRVTTEHGRPTWRDNLPAPSFPNAQSEPILMGFVLVHSGNPHYPIWLYKAKPADANPA